MCSQSLHRHKLGRVHFYFCPHHGDLISYQFLRSLGGTEKLVETFRRMLGKPIEDSPDRKINCPRCGRAMAITPLEHSSKVRIDQCRPCGEIWFDIGELNKVKDKGELEQMFPRVELKPELAEFKPRKEQDFFSVEGQGPGSPLQLFGLPGEVVDQAPRSRPIGPVFLVLLCFFFSVTAWKSPALFGRWMYDPSDPFRSWGFTLISASLIHGNWIHLLMNMYFLWLTADNIEDRDGTGFLFTLFGGSALAAHVAYSYMGGTVPTVGASGAIAGLVMYYGLAFPSTRLEFFRFMFWGGQFHSIRFSISAQAAILIYFALQFMHAYIQMNTGSSGGINYISHAAGGACGFLFYMLHNSKTA